MRKDIELRDGDTITAFEISLTFFIIVRQANNFNFSKLNLFKTYMKHQNKIEEIQDELDQFGDAFKKKLANGKKLTPGQTPDGQTPDKEE